MELRWCVDDAFFRLFRPRWPGPGAARPWVGRPVSPFFFPEGRRILERSLGLFFTLVVIGGVALAWRADKLRDADRDLTPAQQAALSNAISQFPNLKFEMFTSRADREAHALALKIAAAAKAGSGAMPPFNETMPAPPKGVVLIL